MNHTCFLKIFLLLGFATILGGCGHTLARPTAAQVRIEESFARLLGYVQSGNYVLAYSSAIGDQREFGPTNAAVAEKYAQFRVLIRQKALDESIANIRTNYYQGNFQAAMLAKKEAEYIVLSEGLDAPNFLISIGRKLEHGRQQLFLLYQPPPPKQIEL